MIRTRAVQDAEDLPVTLACTVTRLRVTDFWTWGTLGLGRNRCWLLEWLDPEPNPAKTNPNSARRISTSAMGLMVRLAEHRFQRFTLGSDLAVTHFVEYGSSAVCRNRDDRPHAALLWGSWHVFATPMWQCKI